MTTTHALEHKHIYTALFLVVLSLPITHDRIGVGIFTLSVTSVLALFCITLIAVYDFDKITKALKVTPSRLTALALATISILLFATISKNYVGAWGILVEWFVLPGVVVWMLTISIGSDEGMHHKILTGLLYVLGISALSALSFALLGALTYDHRLAGLWPSPNHLALFLVPLTIATLPLVQRAGSLRTIPFIIIASAIAAILLTKSIAGIATLLLALLTFISVSCLQKKDPKMKALVVFLILTLTCLSIFVLAPRIADFMTNIDRSSLASRITVWDVTTDTLRTHAIIPSDSPFQETYLEQQKYHEPFLEWAVPSAHNVFLMLWFTGGWFLLLSASLTLAFIFLTGARTLTKYNNPLTLASILALTTVVLHGLLDTSYFRTDLAYVFCIITFLAVHRVKPPSAL